MHAAIDLRIIDPPGMEKTGAGRYALEAARALHAARPRWPLSLFSNRPELLGWASEQAQVIHSAMPTRRAAARVAWLHSAAALSALRLRPALWFSPSFVLPLWWRGPAVVTIHDLTFLLMPHRYRGTINARYASVATRASARRADRILCGSQATREALVEHLDVSAERVVVIPYGVADVFFGGAGAGLTAGRGAEPGRASNASPESDAAPGSQEKPLPYVLFVGTREARKGLATLHAAVRFVNAGGRRVRLVLAGQEGWGTEELMRALKADPFVELRDGPSDEELAMLYRDALALAYPSEMEGFGLPVAEAMARGCPVIASELPSIREFAGDQPLYIGTGDSSGLAAHVERLLAGDPEMPARLERGREAVAGLRWSALGELTAQTMEAVMAERSR